MFQHTRTSTTKNKHNEEKLAAKLQALSFQKRSVLKPIISRINFSSFPLNLALVTHDLSLLSFFLHIYCVCFIFLLKQQLKRTIFYIFIKIYITTCFKNILTHVLEMFEC